MARIDAYPAMDPPSGFESFAAFQAGHVRTGTFAQMRAYIQGLNGTPRGGTNQFYRSAGAEVARFSDRVLMGAAADNQGDSDRDEAPTDWLSEVMAAHSTGAWATWGAQSASLARFGSIGFLAASRTSDAKAAAALLGYTPASIGIASWVINDDTSNPTSTTGWGNYTEAWRMPGVNYQPTFCHEMQAVNFGGLAVGISNPYHPNVGGGVYCLQLGAGGGHTSGVSDAAAIMVFVNNPTRFQKGFVFSATCLAGTDGTSGDSGYAAAFSFARNQGIEWWAPDGNVAVIHRSTVTASNRGTRLEHQDNAVVLTNSNGQQIFSAVAPANGATAFASLFTQTGNSAAQAAGIYVAPANGSTNGNLGLFPASGGELQITSPVSGPGSAVPAAVGPGWLHINVNGTDYRLPLFTAAQAGS